MAGQKVKVSELVADIKKGVSDPELVAKYGVSDPQLKALEKKLLEMGRLTQDDIDRRAQAAPAKKPASPPEPPQPPPASKPREVPKPPDPPQPQPVPKPPQSPKPPEPPQPPPAAKPPEVPKPPEPPPSPSAPAPPEAPKPPETPKAPVTPKEKKPVPDNPVDAEAAIDMLGDDHGWKCPACGQPHDKKPEECPSCGVIVEKFIKRQKEIEEAKEAMAAMEAQAQAGEAPAEEQAEAEPLPEAAAAPEPPPAPAPSSPPPAPQAKAPESAPAPPEAAVSESGEEPKAGEAAPPSFASSIFRKPPVLAGIVLTLVIVVIVGVKLVVSPGDDALPKESRQWISDQLTSLPVGYVGRTYARKDREKPIGLYLKVKEVNILKSAKSSGEPSGDVIESYCAKLEITSDVSTGPALPKEYLQRFRKYTTTDGWDYHRGWEKLTAKTSPYKEFKTVFNTMVDLTKPKEAGKKFDTHFSQVPQPKVIYTGSNCPNNWDTLCPFGCKAE